MREPPPDVTDDEVLALVRSSWSPQVDGVEQLPVGLGARHWRASVGGVPAYFLTLDRFGGRHTPASLEAAYAGAAGLSFALDFVVAPLAAASGRHTVPLADGALSATLWVHGEPAGDGPHASGEEARAWAGRLARLHAQPTTAALPRWAPRDDDPAATLATTLAGRLAEPWDSGPYAAPAQAALRAHLADVERWTVAHHRLATEAADRPWVPTHGEPDTRHLVRTLSGHLRLVGWESLRVAPRERDLRTLVESGAADAAAPYWPMVELFDLERRLDEVERHAAWLAAPHAGSASDRVALERLLTELDRPALRPPRAPSRG